jgi:beta-galactosidase
MAAAGFAVIRVGESVWSTWEPRTGCSTATGSGPSSTTERHGIGVVLGTPTYAVPMWLARRHPEINVERATGQPMGWGARQEIDYSHPSSTSSRSR